MRTAVAIVGGGVVGLACAAAVARQGRDVVLLERHARVGTETSSRNSEVIHAGLYYPPGSLKAQTCVRGRTLLYERCARLGIAHRRLGKLVVATDESQLEALSTLKARGEQNGAGALRWLDPNEARALEPRVRCSAALFSPETGIVDSHALIESYRREAEAHGALVVPRTRVQRVERRPEGWRLVCRSGSDPAEQQLDCNWLINAAGLASDQIAGQCGVEVDARGLTLHPCKGDYFALHPRFRGQITHLVYPLPSAAGLGIHLTLDLSGALRAGPDARYVHTLDYAVDTRSRERFARAIQRYLPALRDEDLQPDYAGVRPKLAGPGEAFRDFELAEWPEAPRSVHLIGIESPGLTAAGALAERVAKLLAARHAA